MQSSRPARTAIVYDFDNTLAPGHIQDSLLSHLNEKPKRFWSRIKRLRHEYNSDIILVFMQELIELARRENKPLTREMMEEYGKEIKLFKGVDGWFSRMNNYAESIELELEHYVISSGNTEIIKGCSIRKEFKKIFASKYIYDNAGTLLYPGVAVNYTNKVQYLFRINKGVFNHWDDDKVNRWKKMDERRIPFERMIFIGDGDTDIPSMKMIRHKGGFSIAVFDPKQRSNAESMEKLHKLIFEDRVNFVAPADYREQQQLDIIVKGILSRFRQNIR